MPTFEQMRNKYSKNPITNKIIQGDYLKDTSDMVMDITFQNATDYRVGKIYDCNMKEITKERFPNFKYFLDDDNHIDFKFLKTQTYTISKDQVEFMVQFRTGVNLEIDFDINDESCYPNVENMKNRSLSFYVDILDRNSGLSERWLVVGKDTSEFNKYIVLKCNWLFEWLDGNKIYRNCLGVIRDRNNYNSGVWASNFSESIENQLSFIIPNNKITKCIEYDKRFMITDNEIHPKTYRITKLMDLFPRGNIKVVCTQSHYNENTDFIGKDEAFFRDDRVHMICDYYKSNLPSKNEDDDVVDNDKMQTWSIKGGSENIYIFGNTIYLEGIYSGEDMTKKCKWHIYIDGELCEVEEISDYFKISIDEDTNIISIKAINRVMAKYVLTVGIYDEDSEDDYAKIDMGVTI